MKNLSLADAKTSHSFPTRKLSIIEHLLHANMAGCVFLPYFCLQTEENKCIHFGLSTHS